MMNIPLGSGRSRGCSSCLRGKVGETLDPSPACWQVNQISQANTRPPPQRPMPACWQVNQISPAKSGPPAPQNPRFFLMHRRIVLLVPLLSPALCPHFLCSLGDIPISYWIRPQRGQSAERRARACAAMPAALARSGRIHPSDPERVVEAALTLSGSIGSLLIVPGRWAHA